MIYSIDIRPSDVYTHEVIKQRIKDHMKDYEIVAFMPPKHAELFVMTDGSKIFASVDWMLDQPRFILRPKQPAQKFEEVWE